MVNCSSSFHVARSNLSIASAWGRFYQSELDFDLIRTLPWPAASRLNVCWEGAQHPKSPTIQLFTFTHQMRLNTERRCSDNRLYVNYVLKYKILQTNQWQFYFETTKLHAFLDTLYRTFRVYGASALFLPTQPIQKNDHLFGRSKFFY